MKWSRKSCRRSPPRHAQARSAMEKSFFRALTKRFGFATTNAVKACYRHTNFETADRQQRDRHPPCPLIYGQRGIRTGSRAEHFGEDVNEMTTGATVHSELWDVYGRESAAIEQEFSATGDGRAAVVRRTTLVDSMAQRLWNEIIVRSESGSNLEGPKGFALVAPGGFRRRWLFPHSDIDLLFLHG